MLGLGISLTSPAVLRRAGAAAVTTYLEPATTGSALLGTDTAPITTGQARQTTVHHVRGAATAIVLTLAGCEENTMGGESLTPAYTWEGKVASTLLGTTFPVTKNGVSPVTVSAIEYWVDCDPVVAAFADNDTLTIDELATGTRLPSLGASGANNTQLYTDEACQVAASGLTLAAAPTDSLTRRRRMCTISAVSRVVTSKWATTTVAINGDSRCAGQTSTLPANYASADHVRGPFIKSVSPTHACYNLGIGADQASSALGAARPMQRMLERRASVVLGAKGINEMENRQMSGAAAWAWRGREKALYPGQRYLSATLPPRTSSTDGFITEANQTAITSGSKTAEINNYNTIALASGEQIWNLRALIQGTNTDVYSAPAGVAQTLDGLHETPAGITTEVADAATLITKIATAPVVASNSQPSIALTLTGTPTFSGGKFTRGTATLDGTAASGLPSTWEGYVNALAVSAVDVLCGSAGRLFINSSGIPTYTRQATGTQYQAAAPASIVGTGEHFFRVVTTATGTNVYMDDVNTPLITVAVVPNSTQTNTRIVATATNAAGTLRDLASFASDRTGVAAPGAGVSTAAVAGNVGYWPLATDGSGQIGPWFASI